MIESLEDIETASREELVEYLESRCIACYDSESDEVLRVAALEDWPVFEEEIDG